MDNKHNVKCKSVTESLMMISDSQSNHPRVCKKKIIFAIFHILESTSIHQVDTTDRAVPCCNKPILILLQQK